MIVYVESSVLLRKTMKQEDEFKNWGAWSQAITSELTYVECMRSIDRFRLQGSIDDQEAAEQINQIHQDLRKFSRVRLYPEVLNRAAQPFITAVKTLDAIHLSSALLWQQRSQQALVFLTHDRQLGRAALACGFQVQDTQSPSS